MRKLDLVIRHFQPADREAVNAVACAAFAQYQHDYEDWPAFNERLARMADLAGQADLMVAEADGEVLGAVVHVGPGKPRSVVFPDDWSVIRMLVVAPGHRGQGIGQQLVAACLPALRYPRRGTGGGPAHQSHHGDRVTPLPPPGFYARP